MNDQNIYVGKNYGHKWITRIIYEDSLPDNTGKIYLFEYIIGRINRNSNSNVCIKS